MNKINNVSFNSGVIVLYKYSLYYKAKWEEQRLNMAQKAREQLIVGIVLNTLHLDRERSRVNDVVTKNSYRLEFGFYRENGKVILALAPGAILPRHILLRDVGVLGLLPSTRGVTKKRF